jgi:effector-binding domain-containing protein
MEYRVEVKQVAAQPIAVVRRRASQQELSRVVPDACGTVWAVLRSQQVSGAGRHVAVYYDGQINLEVGAEVDPSFAGYGEVVASHTPAGTVATTTHLGPYHLLVGAHEAVLKHCRDHGHALAGPSWEVYGHWTDDPARLQTDVYYLLQDADQPSA